MIRNYTKRDILLPSKEVIKVGDNPDLGREIMDHGDNREFMLSLLNTNRIRIDDSEFRSGQPIDLRNAEFTRTTIAAMRKPDLVVAAEAAGLESTEGLTADELRRFLVSKYVDD